MADEYEEARRNPYRDDPQWEPWHAEAVDVQGGAEDESSSGSESEIGASLDLPEICICQHCRFDETKAPFCCCGQENCVSLSDRVTKLLDPLVLEIQLAHRFRDRVDHNELRPESFRFVAYRNLFFLMYGRTRMSMSRKPLPSCLVLQVRRAYPDPNQQYTGYKPKRQKRH